MSELDDIQWLWREASFSQRERLLDQLASEADDDSLIWLWENATFSQRERLVRLFALRMDPRVRAWIWNAATYAQREVLFDAFAHDSDQATIRWLWEVGSFAQRERLTDIIAKRGLKTAVASKQLDDNSSNPILPDATERHGLSIFICHASEDKESFVRPLAKELLAGGALVWLDEYELTIGDALRSRIDHGLSRSRFGVVVISPAFFANEWPMKELDGLFSKESSGVKVILPVWHNISQSEVAEHSPLLAGRLAAKSSFGARAVASQLLDAIKASTRI